MTALPAGTLALLHCDGASGSTTFTNAVSGGLTYTAAAAAALTTTGANVKFGSAAGDFTAVGRLDPSAAVNFTGDFWITWQGSRNQYTGKIFCIGNETAAGAMNLEHFVNNANLITTNAGGTAIGSTSAPFGQPGDGYRQGLVMRVSGVLYFAVEDSGGQLQLVGSVADTSTYSGNLVWGDKYVSGGTPEGSNANFWFDEIAYGTGNLYGTSFPQTAETAAFTLSAGTAPVQRPLLAGIGRARGMRTGRGGGLIARLMTPQWRGVTAAAAPVSASLTGVSATASAGTPVAAIAPTLAGSAATAAAGALSPALAATLTGAQATSAPGTPVAAVVASISGVAGTSAAGSVSGAVAPALTGAAGTAAAGSVGVDVVVTLTGASATASAGTVTVQSGNSANLTGASATGQAGNLAPAIAVPLVGAAATAAPGMPVAAVATGLTGVSGAAAAGALGVATAPTLTGAGAAAAAGQPGAAVVVTLTGAQATAAAGNVVATSGQAANLTGAQATAQAGAVGVAVVVQLTGAQASAQAGNVTVDGAAPGFRLEIENDLGPAPRFIPIVGRQPVLQRVLAARGPRIKPTKERAAKRAKAIEVQAAREVVDGQLSQPQLLRMALDWIAQGPLIPPELARAPALDLFLPQVAMRIAQLQLLERQAEDDDEDAILALLA